MSSGELSALMELDRSIDRLGAQRAHLLERTELARVEGELRERLGALRAKEAVLEPAQRTYDDASSESSRLRARRDQIASTLEASRDARASAALAHELDQLNGTLAVAEDRELEALVEVEPLQNEAAALRRDAQPLAARRAALIEAVAAREVAIDEERAEQRARREVLSAALAPALARRYDAAFKRAGVSGAARVVEGRCDGCRIALSPLDLDRWRHAGADEYFECPSCGRLLLG